MRALVLFLGAAAATSALPGCVFAPGGPEEEPRTVAEPILDGEDDDGDPAIVQIRGGIGACTGTLVTENVVLTAAHCLIEPRPNEVFFGAEPDGDGTVVAIEDWLVHPEVDELRVIQDLGLVR